MKRNIVKSVKKKKINNLNIFINNMIEFLLVYVKDLLNTSIINVLYNELKVNINHIVILNKLNVKFVNISLNLKEKSQNLVDFKIFSIIVKYIWVLVLWLL